MGRGTYHPRRRNYTDDMGIHERLNATLRDYAASGILGSKLSPSKPLRLATPNPSTAPRTARTPTPTADPA